MHSIKSPPENQNILSACMLNGVGAPSVRIKFDLIAYACVNAIVWETLSTAPSKPDSETHQTKPNEMNAYTLVWCRCFCCCSSRRKKPFTVRIVGADLSPKWKIELAIPLSYQWFLVIGFPKQ